MANNRFTIGTMWLQWIALLVFTAELSLTGATVYGSVNDSPEDAGHGPSAGASAGLRLLSQPPPLDFVDTRSGFGSRETDEESGKHMDLFSQLKHLQLPSRSHQYSVRNEHKPASESEMANVRRSLAAVLQVLLPYGRLQQRPQQEDDRAGALADDGPMEYGALGGSLLPDGPETANYMLHGKLVEIGPRRPTHEAARTPLPDPSDDGTLGIVGQKRAAALRTTVARRSHALPVPSGGGSSEESSFLPSISVGALTNLGDFFQNLKHNLESLESKHLNTDQVKLLEGQNMISNLRKEFVADYPKPAGSAAFLHAIRNYRPSHRIRALVSTVPELYRGTNYHDPVYMLAGLGK